MSAPKPPAIVRYRGLLLALLALSLILDALILLTTILLGAWGRTVVFAAMFLLVLIAYLTVRDFKP